MARVAEGERCALDLLALAYYLVLAQHSCTLLLPGVSALRRHYLVRAQLHTGTGRGTRIRKYRTPHFSTSVLDTARLYDSTRPPQ
eukprot:3182154-Rhodomonas_salina.1